MKEGHVPSAGLPSNCRSLFDNGVVGIFETTPQGRVLAVNPGFASMLGFSSPEEMIAEVPDIRALYSNPKDCDRILASLSHSDQIKDLEMSLTHRNGSPIWFTIGALGVRNDAGELVRLQMFAMDITSRKRAEETLQRERAKLEEAQTITHMGSWEWDVITNVVTWSRELYRIFGLAPGEVEASYESLLERVHPDDRDSVKASVERCYKDKTAFEFDYRIVRSDARVRRLKARGRAILDDGGNLIKMAGTAQDITEAYEFLRRNLENLRMMDADRRVLLDRLSDVHEHERVRIARELHDGLGQTLTSISLFAKDLEEDIPAPYSARLEELRKIAETAIVSIRSMVRNLRPIELDQLGLSAAVHRLVQEIRAQFAMPVNLRIWGKQSRLNERTEIAAYRIVQESMTNALRHSSAQFINVELGFEEETLLISVDDDGVGFEASKDAHRKGHLGLMNMDERARAVGGKVVIESRPGFGTAIRVRLPVEADVR